MKLLEIDHVSAYYGDFPALRHVSLSVEEGKLVSIVGANGAGKSTLLKVICGLLHCSSGSIHFMEQRIDRLQAHEIAGQGIAYVQEGRALFTSMTVLENLEMGAFLVHDANSREKMLKFVFSLFPVLAQRKSQLASTLSGGEQQMLALARGIMSQPKLLILDEPSLGLSPLVVKDLFKTIVRINSDHITILLVEQNVSTVLRFCHKGYILESGSIVLEGTGFELLINPHVKDAYLGL